MGSRTYRWLRASADRVNSKGIKLLLKREVNNETFFTTRFIIIACYVQYIYFFS